MGLLARWRTRWAEAEAELAAARRREQERPWRASRVDVVRVTGNELIYRYVRGKDTGGATEVTCEVEGTGQVLRLAYSNFDAEQHLWPVGARLSVRWDAATTSIPTDGASTWRGDGVLVGRPGPAELPGQPGVAPGPDYYVSAVCRPLQGEQGRMHVALPTGESAILPIAEFGVDEALVAQGTDALVRFDWDTRTVTEVLPLPAARS